MKYLKYNEAKKTSRKFTHIKKWDEIESEVNSEDEIETEKVDEIEKCMYCAGEGHNMSTCPHYINYLNTLTMYGTH